MWSRWRRCPRLDASAFAGRSIGQPAAPHGVHIEPAVMPLAEAALSGVTAAPPLPLGPSPLRRGRPVVAIGGWVLPIPCPPAAGGHHGPLWSVPALCRRRGSSAWRHESLHPGSRFDSQRPRLRAACSANGGVVVRADAARGTCSYGTGSVSHPQPASVPTATLAESPVMRREVLPEGQQACGPTYRGRRDGSTRSRYIHTIAAFPPLPNLTGEKKA